MIVSLVGAGKMGLPVAALFAENGARVYACDINQELVDAINRGECPIDEPGVPELVRRQVDAGRLSATTDSAAAAAESDVVVIIVPALLTDDLHADLGILESVTRQVAETVRPGTLICYETTLPVGTTRNVFRPLFGERKVHICFSPERVKSGMVLQRLGETPKVVGGLDAESLDQAADFYGRYLGAPVVRVASLEDAEFVKLAGMLYRDVNIALANELSRYADDAGIDFPSLIGTINGNGEAQLLQPGVGVGGHCTPVYPYFMIHDAADHGRPLRLAPDARAINDEQPEYLVGRLDQALDGLEGTRVLILGLGFRPGVKEHICSPAYALKDALEARGAEVLLKDSLYTEEELAGYGFKAGAYTDAEALVLNTAHPEFAAIDFTTLRDLKAVVDGRNLWDARTVAPSGAVYIGVGRGQRG